MRHSQAYITFDQETGQVFEETIIQTIKNNDRGWDRKIPVALCTKYPTPKSPRAASAAYDVYCRHVEDNRAPKTRGGRRTLFDMVLTSLVTNMRHLSPGTLNRLPVHLLRRLVEEHGVNPEAVNSLPEDVIDLLPLSAVEDVWTGINQRAQLNLNMWKMLSKRLRSEKSSNIKELGLRRYRQKFKSPDSELPLYTTPITCPTFDFIAFLSIATIFPMRDLMKVADIVNLGILEVYDIPQSLAENLTQKGAADRLFRGWAELAVQKNAFSVLRVLKFYLPNGLTNSSVRYFNSFPALGVLYPGRSGMTDGAWHEARAIGWAAQPGVPDALDDLYEACNEQAQLHSSVATNWYGKGHEPCYPNPTLWDGCDMTVLPSDNQSQLAAALKELEPPILDLKGHKLPRSDLNDSGPVAIHSPVDDPNFERESENISLRQWPSLINDGSWRAADWRLFCKGFRLASGGPMETQCDWRSLEEFARLGEMRSDKDLRSAGVKETGLAVASFENLFKRITSAAPIVSLTLGPGFEHVHRRDPHSLADRTPSSPWAFLRIKLPERKPDRDDLEPTSQANPGMTKGFGKRRGQSATALRLRPKKKQKFEDFFNDLTG